MFKKFQIEHFRNIKQCSLQLSDGLNFIIGDNAAGKTSILEAMNYIARGQSFRTKNVSHIINRKSDYFQLLATMNTGSIVGMRRSSSEIIARLDRSPIKKLSTLAKSIPLFLITPNSHEIIEKGPEYRRRYTDWGLFHVEPSYGQLIQEYRRILKQRNAALRINPSECIVWDPGFVRSAEKVDDLRNEYINKLSPIFTLIYSELVDKSEISLSYHSGWKQGTRLSLQLEQKHRVDADRGFTSVGPHRADIVIKAHGVIARDVLSRGQQKMAVIALIIAQAKLASQNTTPILLIDDLLSELDAEHQAKLMYLIRETHSQAIITSVDSSIVKLVEDYALFHVEHGVVTSR